MANDELDFTAEQDDRYLKLEDGLTYYLTIEERLADHEEFKLGKGAKAVAAPVFRVRLRDGKTYRLSVTSTQLWKSLQNVEKHLGTYMGRKLKVKPEGDGTDRIYRVLGVRENDGTTQAAIPTG